MNDDTQLNAVGVLTRREIEARIVGPLLKALGDAFGQAEVLDIARQVIIQVARQQGIQLAQGAGDAGLNEFAGTLEAWKKDGAMVIEVLEQGEQSFSFNVKRCRYAEMYRELGIPELGLLLSCNRDAALIEGFNPNIELERTQTIMEGAPFCDFRYRLSERPPEEG